VTTGGDEEDVVFKSHRSQLLRIARSTPLVTSGVRLLVEVLLVAISDEGDANHLLVDSAVGHFEVPECLHTVVCKDPDVSRLLAGRGRLVVDDRQARIAGLVFIHHAVVPRAEIGKVVVSAEGG